MKELALAAVLTTLWPNGEITTSRALNMESCRIAAAFNLRPPLDSNGKPMGLPLAGTPAKPRLAPALRASCAPATPAAAGFAKHWNCIKSNGKYICD